MAGTTSQKWRRSAIACRPKSKTPSWTALNEAVGNAAKLIVARREEIVHILVALGYIFRREVAMKELMQPAGDPGLDSSASEIADCLAAMAFLSALGQALVKLSTSVSFDVLQLYLLPAAVPALMCAAPGTLQQMIRTLSSFYHPNALDDVKKFLSLLHVALTSENNGERYFLCVMCTFSNMQDLGSCYGADVLCQYYVNSCLYDSSHINRLCGVLMAQKIVLSSRNALPLLQPILPQLLALKNGCVTHWELAIQLLDLLCRMEQLLSSVPAPEEAGEDNGTANLQAYREEQAASIRESVLDAFRQLEVCSPLVRKASLRSIAPHVVYNTNHAAMCELFLRRLLSFDDASRYNLMRRAATGGGVGSIEALPGKARSFYVAGALSEVWNAPGVATCLTNLRLTMSTADVLSILEPLVLGADLTADPSFWLGIAAQLKDDLCDPIFNPANVRNVAQTDIGMCAEMAFSVTTKLYVDVSGEAVEQGLAFADIQQRAVEWMESNL